jgi:3-oxoacyl-[acyl-carrier protein] reductase
MNKTALVTGASRGIGRAVARLFAENNYNVVINYYKNEAKAFELLRELKSSNLNAVAICANVSVRKEVDAMFEKIRSVFGGADVLVNNAGIARQELFTDISENDWNEMFDINVRGMFNCTQAAAQYMISNKYGKIINISSMWGIAGASCETAYSSSKAAVIGFTKALAKELGPSGICVNCIAPGLIDTDMNSGLSDDIISELKERTPLGRMGTAEDIANLALFLASGKSDFITGQVIAADGGFIS